MIFNVPTDLTDITSGDLINGLASITKSLSLNSCSFSCRLGGQNCGIYWISESFHNANVIIAYFGGNSNFGLELEKTKCVLLHVYMIIVHKN